MTRPTKRPEVMAMMEEGEAHEQLKVLGSHWNRYKLRDEGTGIHWNKQVGKWEAVVVRNLGYFDKATDAAQMIERHMEGVERWFIEELINETHEHLIAAPVNEERNK